MLPTTEWFFIPCHKEQRSPAVRAVCIITHVATPSVVITGEAFSLQKLVIRFTRKWREVAAWGDRVSEEFVCSSVITKTPPFHIWCSWKRKRSQDLNYLTINWPHDMRSYAKGIVSVIQNRTTSIDASDLWVNLLNSTNYLTSCQEVNRCRSVSCGICGG